VSAVRDRFANLPVLPYLPNLPYLKEQVITIHPTSRNAPSSPEASPAATAATMDGWRLELPYQSLPLSLNDRRHRMVIWRAQRNLRNQVRVLTRAHRIPRLDRIHVALHFQPTTKRTRDEDNAVATLKSAIDGLRDYPEKRRDGRVVELAWRGVVADDDPAHVTWDRPTIHPAVSVKQRPAGSRLWLIITEVPSV
jgi:hypothetical protein